MDSSSRQEYIKAAVSFLRNPKLIDSPLKDKLKFLKDKGLSELEVDEALNLALINRQQSQSGKWNFIIVLGLCYGGYKLYQAYQQAKELETTQENQARQSETLRKSNAAHDQPTLAEILDKMRELKRHLENQRSDIQSLKTLLLGPEKFAAPPVIPAWQLKDLDSKDDKEDSAIVAPI